jgi:hypothetical protein
MTERFAVRVLSFLLLVLVLCVIFLAGGCMGFETIGLTEPEPVEDDDPFITCQCEECAPTCEGWAEIIGNTCYCGCDCGYTAELD